MTATSGSAARSHRPLIAALVVLVVGIVLLGMLAREFLSNSRRESRRAFNATAQNVSTTLTTLLHRDADFLTTMRGVVMLAPAMTDSQFAGWYAAVDGRNVQVGGLGTAVLAPVPAAGAVAFQAERNADPTYRSIHWRADHGHAATRQRSVPAPADHDDPAARRNDVEVRADRLVRPLDHRRALRAAGTSHRDRHRPACRARRLPLVRPAALHGDRGLPAGGAAPHDRPAPQGDRRLGRRYVRCRRHDHRVDWIQPPTRGQSSASQPRTTVVAGRRGGHRHRRRWR